MERDETIKVLEELADQCAQVANIFCTQDSEERREALGVVLMMLKSLEDGDLISRAGALKSISDGIMRHTTMRELRENPLAAVSEGVAEAILEVPPVDAEVVIRCKDCEHRKKNTFCLEHNRYERDDDGYCHYAERREP